MKKNYLFPVTENVQLNGCSIMQAAGGSGITPMVNPPIGGGEGFDAPSRNIGKMYI